MPGKYHPKQAGLIQRGNPNKAEKKKSLVFGLTGGGSFAKIVLLSSRSA